MKSLLHIVAFALLLFSAACSQDVVSQNPRGFEGNSNAAKHKKGHKAPSTVSRKMDRSVPLDKKPSRGIGFDVNAKNPTKFKTVRSTNKYHYAKPGRVKKVKEGK